VDKGNKKLLLAELLRATCTARSSSRAPSTAPTSVVRELDREGIEAMAIHGNKSQRARQNALNFLQGRARSGCWWPPTSRPAASTS
jgi:superfamily II DNA/RNA helicase